MQPLVTKPEGKNLIQVIAHSLTVFPIDGADLSLQACLNAPEPAGDQNGVETGDVPESPEDVTSLPPNQAGMPRGVPPGGYMPQQVNDPYYGMQAQGGQYTGIPGMAQHQRGAV